MNTKLLRQALNLVLAGDWPGASKAIDDAANDQDAEAQMERKPKLFSDLARLACTEVRFARPALLHLLRIETSKIDSLPAWQAASMREEERNVMHDFSCTGPPHGVSLHDLRQSEKGEDPPDFRGVDDQGRTCAIELTRLGDQRVYGENAKRRNRRRDSGSTFPFWPNNLDALPEEERIARMEQLRSLSPVYREWSARDVIDAIQDRIDAKATQPPKPPASERTILVLYTCDEVLEHSGYEKLLATLTVPAEMAYREVYLLQGFAALEDLKVGSKITRILPQ